ncbi:MAG TPA: SIMPL domain-containing protein [Candidatus Dormibacteraeota bacterium]|nr:SIMPL domain-containing protein [Candidatus Dormibacteraeota bacterium]
MTSALRSILIPLAVALACSLAVAAIVVAASRPTVLTSSPSASMTTFQTGVFTSGDARVSVKPDLATVSAGVESQQSTAAAAQSDLAAKAGKLISRVKALGVSDADLSTSGYWVGPVYATASQNITGYQANEVLRIGWHNVDTIGKTLDAIVQEGGATNISVGFGLADSKPAEAQARTLAIADARSKAQAMASAAGVKLGQVLRVSDVATATPPPIAYLGSAAPSAATQVPVGQVEVQVSVEVDYTIA